MFSSIETFVSTTTDVQLIGRARVKKSYERVSDEATNVSYFFKCNIITIYSTHFKLQELLETLENANEITPDWEVVYADCPVKASPEADGPFSAPG